LLCSSSWKFGVGLPESLGETMRQLIGKVLIGSGAAILIAAVFIGGIGLPFGVILVGVGGWLIWCTENTTSDASLSKQSKYTRVIFGVLVPIVVLIAGMPVLANEDRVA
jgi:ABC-type branched-subunit amino acid transport system permease subunit